MFFLELSDGSDTGILFWNGDNLERIESKSLSKFNYKITIKPNQTELQQFDPSKDGRLLVYVATYSDNQLIYYLQIGRRYAANLLKDCC